MTKEWLSFSGQVARLSTRGLRVEDADQAQAFLSVTNYYRFSSYFRYWQRDPLRGDNTFVAGSSFETIQGLYEAEQMLAAECLRVLGKTELLFRTLFAHHYAALVTACGGLTSGKELSPSPDPKKDDADEFVMRDLDRSKEVFVRHYRNTSYTNHQGKYTAQAYAELPVWIAVEALSFGTLSRCLEASEGSGVLAAVADEIDVAHATLASQIRSLVYLRNHCAHHARLWNHSVLDSPGLNNNIARRAKKKYGAFEDRAVFRILIVLDLILEQGDLERNWLERKVLPILTENAILEVGLHSPRKYGNYVPPN